MRNHGSSRFDDPEWDQIRPGHGKHARSRNWRPEPANPNAPEEVFGEIGLVLVIVLGVVLAVNMLLGALHIV